MNKFTVIGEEARQYKTIVPTIGALASKSEDIQDDFLIAQKKYLAAEAAVKRAIEDLKKLEQLENKKRRLSEPPFDNSFGLALSDCFSFQNFFFFSVLIRTAVLTFSVNIAVHKLDNTHWRRITNTETSF